ncbi:MAG: hypothetical protein GY807_02975 [Gammaproteobacteria bacterium]|nr:hypothetical protein [Gammaproteobacteria bacterium]
MDRKKSKKCKSVAALAYKSTPFFTAWLLMCTLVLAGCQLNLLKKEPDQDQPAMGSARRDAQEPKWIHYPPHGSGMAYGVGSSSVYRDDLAPAIQSAKENARSELLKGLRVQVQEETYIEKKKQTSQHGATSFTSKLRQEIYSRIPQIELSGIEVTETYVSQNSSAVYALAQLDREQVATGLKQEIEQLDKALKRFVLLPDDLSKHAQLKRLLPASALMAKRDKIEARLGLVYGHPPSVVTPPEEAQLNRRINDLLNGLVIVLHPQGQAAKAMEPYLLKQLTKSGLVISSAGVADVTMIYQVRTRTKRDRGMYFTFADGDIVVKDEENRIVNAVDAAAKGVSGVSRDQARVKAIKQLGDRLGEALREGFLKRIMSSGS